MTVDHLPERRILFVHAHPDDETISTGATMARYAATGAHVTLVTCTLGEEGEVHLPSLSDLAATEADQLGGYRLVELERACAALGVTDHRFLGSPGRYRDSGMMGTPANDHPRAFWRAEVDQAAGQLLDVVREIRPQVVVTYDEVGGYGHPDHIQTHRVTMRCVEMAASEGIAPAKVYWMAIPLSILAEGIEQFAQSENNPFAGVENVDDLPFGTPDEKVSAQIVSPNQTDAKVAAIRAHATQIPQTSWLYTLATNFGSQFMSTEHFSLVSGVKGNGSGPHGWEDDLFAGVGSGPSDSAGADTTLP